MKNVLLAVMAAVIVVSCSVNREPKYTLSGTLPGIDTGYIYLEKTDVHPWVALDSARIENGKFSMTGKVGLPEMYALLYREKQIFVPVFVENSPIEVTIYPDSADRSLIKGSATQDLYNRYEAQTAEMEKKMEAVDRAWKAAKDANDSAGMKLQDSLYTILNDQVKANIVSFAKANGKSVVAPYLIIRNNWQFDLAGLKDVTAAFDTSLNGSTYMKALRDRIAILEKVAIGQPAVQFTLNDSLGNPVPLSQFAGKVLLIDFWASWCKPCRAENPNVVKAYGMFNKKGFEVLGVSLDQKRERWSQAVKDDKLSWTQVSDLKGWGSSAGQAYGISSIPANFLLDKDQKIIATNLRGDELVKKLTGLLGPPLAVKTPKKKPASAK